MHGPLVDAARALATVLLMAEEIAINSDQIATSAGNEDSGQSGQSTVGGQSCVGDIVDVVLICSWGAVSLAFCALALWAAVMHS